MAKDKSIPKEAEAAVEKVGASALGVYVKGVFVREYSAEIHGEKFKQNAEDFAKQFPTGEVRKMR